MFDLTDTVFADSTGIGVLIRLRKRAREAGWQFFLIAPRPPVEAALKLMKLDDFFTIQASFAGVRTLMESAAGAAAVTSDVQENELQIRWSGEVTALNAIELGAYTEAELSQVLPGMTVMIDLSRVTFVDSTCIGLMVRFKKKSEAPRHQSEICQCHQACPQRRPPDAIGRISARLILCDAHKGAGR